MKKVEFMNMNKLLKQFKAKIQQILEKNLFQEQLMLLQMKIQMK